MPARLERDREHLALPAQADDGRRHDRHGPRGLAVPAKTTIELSGAILTLFEKRIQGSLFGSGDPFHDIPRMVELYQSGDLKLDELITTTYTLDQVNQGYQDLLDGKNIRGVIRYADA